MALARTPGVHALTDVTGFGLAGHTLEVARSSGLSAVLRYGALPLLPEVRRMVGVGLVTGASARNWAAYGEQVALGDQLPPEARALVTDPQTSGGLLVSCAPDAADAVLRVFKQAGFEHAAVIGQMLPRAGHCLSIEA